MVDKYLWVREVDEALKRRATQITYFLAGCVCFFRGHDYQKYTLTVCDRCMKIGSFYDDSDV
jgi:hypothetical protein